MRFGVNMTSHFRIPETIVRLYHRWGGADRIFPNAVVFTPSQFPSGLVFLQIGLIFGEISTSTFQKHILLLCIDVYEKSYSHPKCIGNLHHLIKNLLKINGNKCKPLCFLIAIEIFVEFFSYRKKQHFSKP